MELEANIKLFGDHISSILDGALVGAGNRSLLVGTLAFGVTDLGMP
jgi:hypothetical protein